MNGMIKYPSRDYLESSSFLPAHLCNNNLSNKNIYEVQSKLSVLQNQITQLTNNSISTIQLEMLKDEISDIKQKITNSNLNAPLPHAYVFCKNNRRHNLLRNIIITFFSVVSLVALVVLITLLVCFFGRAPSLTSFIANNQAFLILGHNALSCLSIIASVVMITSMLFAYIISVNCKKHLLIKSQKQASIPLTYIYPPEIQEVLSACTEEQQALDLNFPIYTLHHSFE
ncbi:hypothetical protein CLAVI_000871 [Candidatus Clavichlamydia salmonicola]|uniref:hypothetical protein n=1 Tax=Candidatus Clavichlamydia salmonicola TaxID=469812 RepID=UPI001891D4D0|nr:hypothetical protein [Candidatus Clavichlamydia salmonicola]MBF5051230.1 hypothetical protein [Candidatus Clavichlamydia salmonicola]